LTLSGSINQYSFIIWLSDRNHCKAHNKKQCWSPRGRALVLEDPWGQFWSPWSWPCELSPSPQPRDSSPGKNSRTHSSPIIALLCSVETGAKRLVGYTFW